MTENIDKKDVLNSASISGLALGVACIAYAGIIYALDKTGMSAMLSTLLKTVLWAAKFVGCIFIMRYFMRRLDSQHGISQRTAFRQGVLSALFSALIVSGATFAQIQFIITPESYEAEMMAAMSQMSGMLDSNSQRAMQGIIQQLPLISFFSTLIYCFLYGTVLSAILSRSMKPSDPFAGYRESKGDDETYGNGDGEDNID